MADKGIEFSYDLTDTNDFNDSKQIVPSALEERIYRRSKRRDLDRHILRNARDRTSKKSVSNERSVNVLRDNDSAIPNAETLEHFDKSAKYCHLALYEQSSLFDFDRERDISNVRIDDAICRAEARVGILFLHDASYDTSKRSKFVFDSMTSTHSC